MTDPKNVVVVVLGGGQGSRLYPLTKNRAKPAVSFGGKYRLIDIPITNCLRSQINRIFILTQFNSFSLNRHIWQSYPTEVGRGGFVEVIAAEQTIQSGSWFQGTADAVRQTMQYILYHRPKHVLILSGDQVYSMDYQQMLLWHNAHDSQVTIAGHFTAENDIFGLGIMNIGPNLRVTQFFEKPQSIADVESYKLDKSIEQPEGKPFLASMGIYLFNTDVLIEALNNTEADFGKSIIPQCAKTYTMRAFPFDGYWEDVGTIANFYEANMEWRKGRGISNMFKGGESIVTHSRQLPPTRIDGPIVEDSIIADGGEIRAQEVRRSIIGVRTRIDVGTCITDSILMGNDRYNEEHTFEIGKNCIIKKTIIDKNCVIGDNCHIINKDGVTDGETPWGVIRSGIIVIEPDAVLPPDTVI